MMRQSRPAARFIGSWLALLSTTTVVAATVIVVARNAISTALFGTTHFGTAVALTALAFVVVRPTTSRAHRVPHARTTEDLHQPHHRTPRTVRSAHHHVARRVGAVGHGGHDRTRRRVGRVRPGRPAHRRPNGDRGPTGPPCARSHASGSRWPPGVIARLGAEFAHRAILLTETNATQVAYFSVAIRFGSIGVLAGTALQFACLSARVTCRVPPCCRTMRSPERPGRSACAWLRWQ